MSLLGRRRLLPQAQATCPAKPAERAPLSPQGRPRALAQVRGQFQAQAQVRARHLPAAETLLPSPLPARQMPQAVQAADGTPLCRHRTPPGIHKRHRGQPKPLPHALAKAQHRTQHWLLLTAKARFRAASTPRPVRPRPIQLRQASLHPPELHLPLPEQASIPVPKACRRTRQIPR